MGVGVLLYLHVCLDSCLLSRSRDATDSLQTLKKKKQLLLLPVVVGAAVASAEYMLAMLTVGLTKNNAVFCFFCEAKNSVAMIARRPRVFCVLYCCTVFPHVVHNVAS